MRWSLRIQQSVAALPEFLAAQTISLYSPFCNEVFTEELFRLGAGKLIAYPRVSGSRLQFTQVENLHESEPWNFWHSGADRE